MQIYQAAEQTLRDLKRPAHLRDIHRHIEEKCYFQFGATDPLRALGVAIDRHCKGVMTYQPADPTVFYRAGPATYGLLETLDASTNEDVELDDAISKAETGLDSSLFLEQELQRWIYKNLQQNQLTNLNLGPLSLVDPLQQDAKQGKFNTRIVGEMDFLLKTEQGDYVIIELKRQSDDQTVGQLCRYWGWVKDNLAQQNTVYGLVIAQEISEGLRYAIKATNESIKYRQLTIDTSLGPEGR